MPDTLTTEQLILSNLLSNEEYGHNVLSFLKLGYFEDQSNKTIFRSFVEYIQKYKTIPTAQILTSTVEGIEGLSQPQFDECMTAIDLIFSVDKREDMRWLVDMTEKFVQDRAIEIALGRCIDIIDGEDENETHTKNSIPDILKSALAISFNIELGHDYIDSASARYEYYHDAEARISFRHEILNLITNGGITRKTLSAFLAGVNVGKTFALIDLCCGYLLNGLNVLYVTLEMAEEEIARRIDANLMDVDINSIEHISHDEFISNIDRIRGLTKGTLKIKQLGTGVGHSGHMQHIIDELKLTSKFTPDVLVVDYIGICASSRIRFGTTNSYGYQKAVAEELRALAIENNLIAWTAAQSNRDGIGSNDIDMSNTADSIGLPATLDLFLAIIRTDELDDINKLMIKQLKNRFANKAKNQRFTMGVNIDRNQMFDDPTNIFAEELDPTASIEPDDSHVKYKRRTREFT